MKITSLRMKNVRCFPDTSVTFDHVNLILALNGAGKSTIKEVIDYALTGRCEHTDRRGGGSERLIRDYGDKASIELTIEGRGMVTRSIPNGLAIPGKSGTLTVLQALLMDALGTDAETISAALNTSQFISLDADGQKNMLFKLAGLRFDGRTVADALHDWAKGKANADEIERELMVAAPVIAADSGPEIFGSLEKWATEKRRDVKRDLARAAGEVDANAKAVPALPEGIELEDRPEAVERLAQLGKERDGLVRESGQSQASSRHRLSLEAEIARVTSEMGGLKAQKPPRSGDDVRELKRLIALEEPELAKDRDALATAKGNLASVTTTIERLADNRARLVTSTGRLTCGTSGGLVDCPLTQEDLVRVRGEVDRRLQEARAQGDAIGRDVSELLDRIAKRQETIKGLRDRLSTAEVAAQQRKDTAAWLESLDKSLKAKEEELAALGPAASVVELTQKTEELEIRISKGQAILKAIDDRVAWLKRDLALNETRARYERAVAVYEQLVEAFSADGIRSKLLSSIIGPIQEYASERLKALTDGRFDIKFDISEGFRIFVYDTGVRRLLQDLSRSEKLRVGVLLQDVLNSLTGMRLLVVDEADMLDGENKGLLMDFLLGVMEDYDTIIVLSTMSNVEAADPGIPGVAIFTIEDGRINRVMRQAAD